MNKKAQNSGFICGNCGREVLPLTNGSYRNHCPFCLYSLHIDNEPGDRASGCLGMMKPKSVVYNPQKGYQILHICEKCGFERRNMRAVDDRQPDDLEAILNLMRNGQ